MKPIKLRRIKVQFERVHCKRRERAAAGQFCREATHKTLELRLRNGAEGMGMGKRVEKAIFKPRGQKTAKDNERGRRRECIATGEDEKPAVSITQSVSPFPSDNRAANVME